MSKYFVYMYHVFLSNFNLANVSSCIDMYLGIFVNRIEIELNIEIV